MATYILLSSIIFLIVALLHLVRVIRDLPMQIGAMSLPMWISWVALFATLALGVWGLTMAIRLCN
ncbi:MAG TPA: hypothetical protein P5279_13320 [Anaerohalosphaeraceae bacterium]|jgi:hypothetical protein|nr:hypothetical protein [Anaerohalosphaeraceae bacterium]HRT51469.1 hypothetical protein [Anaerohalosphaeraceae bacterium]HRT87516.1 hypothetical protein [Anaerohalosphaeraceae bacterium]